MARPAIADRVAVDRARIDRGIAIREVQKKSWDQNVKYFLGEQFDSYSLGANDHELVINKIFPVVRSQAPALFFQNPFFRVYESNRGSDHSETDAKKHVLNATFQQAEGHFAGRMSVLSAYFAYGCIKCGYTPDFVSNPKAGRFLVDPASGEFVIDTTDAQGRVIPKLEHGDYIRDKDGTVLFGPDGLPLLEPPDILIREDFFVRWMPWWRLVHDPEGTNDFRTHRWVAEEWIRPIKEVKEDPLLKNTDGLKASETVHEADYQGDKPLPMGISPSDANPLQSESVAEDEGRLRGWTIYDFGARRIRVLADAGQSNQRIDFYLRDDQMPLWMQQQSPKSGGPFGFLMMNEVPGRWYPMPDIEPLKPVQDEMNIQRSKISTHLLRADRKYIHTADFISSQEEWDKLTGGGDMAFAEVDNMDGIKALEQAVMDPAIYQALPSTNNDFDEIAGAAEQRGIARSDTATQASLLENYQQVRESDRQHLIRTHLIDIGGILLRTIQANMTFPMYVRVADPKDRMPYLFEGTVDPSEMDGDFAVSIDVSSFAPRTDAVYRQQTLSVLQQVFIPLMSNPIGMTFLASEKFLNEVFDIYELGSTEIAEELSNIAKAMVAQQQAQQQAEAAGQTGLPPQAGGLNGQAIMNGGPTQ